LDEAQTGGPQMNAISAKEFLISKVTKEAETEQMDLSNVEKKMLYFTEAHPSLPDIYEVNAAFERNYDSDEYESKIVRLLRSACDRDRRSSPSQEQVWDDALDAMKLEDHYILVMAYRAFPQYRKLLVPTHRVRDYVFCAVIGIALVLFIIGLSIWRH
jgi:hypothetical protein